MFDVTQGVPVPAVSPAVSDMVNLVIRVNAMSDDELRTERDALMRRWSAGERVDRQVFDIVRNISARRALG